MPHLSRLITEQKNYTLLSIRKISHDLAKEHGYTRTRDWLKEISIENYLLECRKAIMLIISKSKENYIIDDLFDIELWNRINSKYNSILISLSLPEKKRIERMKKREHLSLVDAQEELTFLDGWKKKFGIEKVINAANINVDVSNLDVHEVMDLICQNI